MEQQTIQRKELFKEKVTAGSRTYFFDVKESATGTMYLTINEMRKSGDKNEYNRILVFEDQMVAFTEGFKKVYGFLKEHKTETAA
ncbi:MAG TPA: DUF3276 family protein [Candidatus Kapabacteria bacterium]|nr:DUF3276 family protein [Candidatus Kapabacteria bacterium]